VFCSNNVAIFHLFQDITTYAVYVTACDLEKSLNFDTMVEITGHARFLTHT